MSGSAVLVREQLRPFEAVGFEQHSEELPPYVWARLQIFRAFAELGIVPFTQESVEEYKQSKLATSDRFMAVYDWVETGTGLATSFAFISLAPGLLAALATRKKRYFLGPLGAVGVCLAGLAATLFSARFQQMWETASLRTYQGEIPPAVAKMAEALQERLPGVHFSVHYLASDPLLEMHYEGESFYIAMWD